MTSVASRDPYSNLPSGLPSSDAAHSRLITVKSSATNSPVEPFESEVVPLCRQVWDVRRIKAGVTNTLEGQPFSGAAGCVVVVVGIVVVLLAGGTSVGV